MRSDGSTVWLGAQTKADADAIFHRSTPAMPQAHVWLCMIHLFIGGKRVERCAARPTTILTQHGATSLRPGSTHFTMTVVVLRVPSHRSAADMSAIPFMVPQLPPKSDSWDRLSVPGRDPCIQRPVSPYCSSVLSLSFPLCSAARFRGFKWPVASCLPLLSVLHQLPEPSELYQARNAHAVPFRLCPHPSKFSYLQRCSTEVSLQSTQDHDIVIDQVTYSGPCFAS
jgi:hypothetical protein